MCVYIYMYVYLRGCGRDGGGTVDSFILSTLKVGKLSALGYDIVYVVYTNTARSYMCI